MQNKEQKQIQKSIKICPLCNKPIRQGGIKMDVGHCLDVKEFCDTVQRLVEATHGLRCQVCGEVLKTHDRS